MKNIYFLLFFSIILSLAINKFSSGASYEEQLINIQIKKEQSGVLSNIELEPIEIKSIFIDYLDDKELVVKNQLALMKYPEQTRKILLLFGSKSDYKNIIKNYGENIIPVINYFLTTEITLTTKLTHMLGKAILKIKNLFAKGEDNNEIPQELTKEIQAWYAIQTIKNEGHDFLSQFVIHKQHDIRWIQTERFNEGLSTFLTSGIRDLEMHYKTEQEITVKKFLSASIDILAVAGTLKLLRASGKVVRAGKPLRFTRHTKLFGTRLLKTGLAGRLFKYSAVVATAWVAIKHPSLIISMLGDLGKLIGFSPLLIQVLGVSFLVFILFYPLIWVLRLIFRPVILRKLLSRLYYFVRGPVLDSSHFNDRS